MLKIEIITKSEVMLIEINSAAAGESGINAGAAGKGAAGFSIRGS